MMKKIFAFLESVGCFLQAPFLLAIRLYWGYGFAVTGFGKLTNLQVPTEFFQSLGIPYPEFNAIMAGSTELIGGVFLLLGLFSRLVTIPLIGVMTVAYLTAHIDTLFALFTQFDPAPFMSAAPFLFLYASLIVFCFGPGKWSLDYLLFVRPR